MSIRLVSLMAVVADQISKFLVIRFCRLGESVTVLKEYFYITYIQNPGAAFGFMADTPAYMRIPFFILITLGAGLIVYAYQRFIPREKSLHRFSLGLIWGGAMGNFIDRLFYRKVVDFIDVRYHQHQWYVFNLADSCITVGLTLLVLGYLLGRGSHPVERF
jgi:signal peptidase II